MTDVTAGRLTDTAVHRSDAARRRLAKRYAAERRFRLLGLGAVSTAIAALVFLLVTIFIEGIPAFTQYRAVLPIQFTGEDYNPQNIAESDFNALTNQAIDQALPFVEGRTNRRVAHGILSSGAEVILQEKMLDDPSLAAGSQPVALPVSDTVDLYLKGMMAKREELEAVGVAAPSAATGEITVGLAPEMLLLLRQSAPPGAEPAPDGSVQLGSDAPSYFIHLNGGVVRVTGAGSAGATGEALVPLTSPAPAPQGSWSLVRLPPESTRQIDDREVAYVDHLVAAGLVERGFNSIFFTRSASREAEMAGVVGALVGSFLTLVVTLGLSFPIGVASAVYLEEFAPKNRWTDLIEVNINNLAAVPSIVFGLLGLAVFLNFFGLPRSAPLVGGMVLALMTLPTIIIASRAALKAVPPSIREAALGVGASRLQTVFHHVLPLALPGIMTGTIIGMAHALGETAPLLMIGMVAFIVDVPGGFLDAATILPVQIFMWADFPEVAFQQKTSAAIIVLLGFLIVMNALAVILRKRFERRW